MTAGCIGRFTFGSESGIRLGSVRIANATEEMRTVNFLIERSDETVYRGTIEVSGNDGVWPEPTWSSEPANSDLYCGISDVDELQVSELTEVHAKDTEGKCLFAHLGIVEGVHDSTLTVSDVAEQEAAICNF